MFHAHQIETIARKLARDNAQRVRLVIDECAGPVEVKAAGAMAVFSYYHDRTGPVALVSIIDVVTRKPIGTSIVSKFDLH